MIIGCPREIMEGETRVALTPKGVQELVNRGHVVLFEEEAGWGCRISNEDFVGQGAKKSSRPTIFNDAEMIVKVKEPMREESDLLHEGQVLLTFLHLARDEDLTRRLLQKKIIAIGYETIELANKVLPVLQSMSIIAGRLAVQVGATYLQSNYGGRGILLGGLPGISPANVVILGAGNVGLNAATIASGLGSHVTVMGISKDVERLDYIRETLGGFVDMCIIDNQSLPLMVEAADLLICGILEVGARTPKLVTKNMVKAMKPGSVIVDVSVDQGGCTETTHPTTISNPTYVIDGVTHYCVLNMPAMVARTSTEALMNATLPYIMEIADKGLQDAATGDQALAKGINIYMGKMTNAAVSKSLGIPHVPLDEAISEVK